MSLNGYKVSREISSGARRGTADLIHQKYAAMQSMRQNRSAQKLINLAIARTKLWSLNLPDER